MAAIPMAPINPSMFLKMQVTTMAVIQPIATRVLFGMICLLVYNFKGVILAGCRYIYKRRQRTLYITIQWLGKKQSIH